VFVHQTVEQLRFMEMLDFHRESARLGARFRMISANQPTFTKGES
jgi:hypothetical protein